MNTTISMGVGGFIGAMGGVALLVWKWAK